MTVARDHDLSTHSIAGLWALYRQTLAALEHYEATMDRRPDRRDVLSSTADHLSGRLEACRTALRLRGEVV